MVYDLTCQLPPGETAEFNVCRAVPPEALGGMRVWLRSFREPGDEGVYFALAP